MKSITSILASAFVCSVFSFLVIFSSQLSIQPQDVEAQSDTATSTSATSTLRLSGYAWSENIGWISFKDGAQPVTINTDGTLTGYAWSEHIGWIQFGNLSGFPNSSYGTNARIADNVISGWARAVAGIPQTNDTSDNRGGWDGWIALNNVKLDTAPVAPINQFRPACRNGCAWGSDVVGWVDFGGVSTAVQKQSCTGPYGTVIPDGSNFTFYSVPDADGVCATQERTCSNGVLSGNYTELSCDTNEPCTRAGRTLEDGQKAVFFSKAIAGINQTCSDLDAELECKDGEFVDTAGTVNTTHMFARCIANPNFRER